MTKTYHIAKFMTMVVDYQVSTWSIQVKRKSFFFFTVIVSPKRSIFIISLVVPSHFKSFKGIP